MNPLKTLQNELKLEKNEEKRVILQRFFKTKKWEYAQGDEFYGIIVPKVREKAKKYFEELDLEQVKELLHSKIHEERLCALFILIEKYKNKKSTPKNKKEIYKLYLNNTKFINNWDLVDLSAPNIVGNYLFENRKEIKVLEKLAKSELLWDKRISIVSTLYFIREKEFDSTIKISKILLQDEHDLIQKAVGWMLREVGKMDLKIEENFLKENYKIMPRTMLRYAIEKFPEEKRQKYLKGKI